MWQLLNLPVSLFPPSPSSDVLLVCHIAHIFICWLAVMKDSRTGAELHAARCHAWIWYCHICYLPYKTFGGEGVICASGLFDCIAWNALVLNVLISLALMLDWGRLCFRLSSDALSQGHIFLFLWLMCFPAYCTYSSTSTCLWHWVLRLVVRLLYKHKCDIFFSLDRCFISHFIVDMILPELQVRWKVQNNDLMEHFLSVLHWRQNTLNLTNQNVKTDSHNQQKSEKQP